MSKKIEFTNVPPKHVWLDGRLVATQDVSLPITVMGSSGYLAVFEGVRAYAAPDQSNLYVFRLKAHIRRLYQSMKVVRMVPALPPEAMEEGLVQLLRANELHQDAYLRPAAFYDGIKLGSWRYTIGECPGLIIVPQASQSHLMAHRAEHCAVSSWTRISDNAQPPRVKCTANYQNSRMAFMQAYVDGYDEALLMDGRGKISESSMSCFFMVRDGVLITAPVTSSILESITRSTVIRLSREVLDLPVVEREIDRSEVYLAEEAFLCGTGEEITSVVTIDRLPIGQGEPGPIFKSIEALYHNLVRGIDGRYPEWRTPVY